MYLDVKQESGFFTAEALTCHGSDRKMIVVRCIVFVGDLVWIASGACKQQ